MSKSFNMNNVKASNISTIKSVLKQLPYGTKNSISQITGLSVATCNTILNELEERNEILETSYPEQSTGRPPKAYTFNANYAYICCVIISKSYEIVTITYNITNLNGISVFSDSVNFDKFDFEILKETLVSIIASYPSIDIVSLGLPGVVTQTSVIYSSITEVNTPQFTEKLIEAIDKKIVFENDMNAIAYGFFHDDSLNCINSLVMLSFFKGACPGAGIIVNGEILRGHTNFAGEVCMLPYKDNLDWRDIESSSYELASYISHSLSIITSILNPETILLIGKSITDDVFEDINKMFNDAIPADHQPKIEKTDSVQAHYFNGLIAIALENLDF